MGACSVSPTHPSAIFLAKSINVSQTKLKRILTNLQVMFMTSRPHLCYARLRVGRSIRQFSASVARMVSDEGVVLKPRKENHHASVEV